MFLLKPNILKITYLKTNCYEKFKSSTCKGCFIYFAYFLWHRFGRHKFFSIEFMSVLSMLDID